MDNQEKRFNCIYDDNIRYRNMYQQSRNSGIREELEWIKRQLEYASFSERYKTRYDLKRGEIYEIDWGVNVNAEFSSRHYGVVVTDSGPLNPLVTVCPLKTNHHGAHPKSDIDLGCLPELNREHPTLAVVNQIRTLDKLRIFTKKAIGFKEANYLSDSESDNQNSNNECRVIHLSDEKMQIILNAYISMLITRNGAF